MKRSETQNLTPLLTDTKTRVFEMTEVMHESEGNILGVRASGKLVDDDYSKVFVPKLESLLEQFEKPRGLFYMNDTFCGWDLKSAWDNTMLDVRHRGDFEKVAMAGAPVWEDWCVKLAGLLVHGKMRTFPSDQLAQAWDWLRA